MPPSYVCIVTYAGKVERDGDYAVEPALSTESEGLSIESY